MEFLKHLKNTYCNDENLKKLYPKDKLPQVTDAIKFNSGVMLSIQGSYYHYCKPRKTLPYDKYTEMEFAIWTNGNNKFSDVKMYLDTTEYNEYLSHDNTYSYVPVELIEKLYQALKNKFGLKE